MQEYPDAGIIGPKLLNPDGSLQLSTAWSISLAGESKTRQQLKTYADPSQKAAIEQRFKTLLDVDIVVEPPSLFARSYSMNWADLMNASSCILKNPIFARELETRVGESFTPLKFLLFILEGTRLIRWAIEWP